jgi:O-antigen ligase
MLFFKRNNDNFLKLNFIIISIFPLLLISGPFLAEIGMFFLILSYLYLDKFKFFKKKNSIYLYLILILYFLLIISSLISEYKFFSLKSSLLYPRFILFSLAISFFLMHSDKILIVSLYVLLIIFFLLAIDANFQFFFRENIIGLEINSNRVSSFFGDELVLGSYLVRLFPLLISLIIFIYYEKFSIKLNFSILFLFILTDFLVLITGERTSFFLIFFQKTLMLFFVPKLRNIIFINFLVFIVSIFLFINFNTSIKLRIIEDTKKYTKIDFSNKNFRPFTTEHVEIFETSKEMFLNNKASGVGPNNFRKLCSKKEYKLDRRFSCSTHPHNFYIQLLAECGLLSFLIFCYIYFSSFRYYFIKTFNKYNNKKYKDSFILCLVSFSSNFWPLVTSGNFFNNWINMIMYLPLGFLIYNYSKLSQKI